MSLPIERFKDSYQNWRYNPFTAVDMAVDKEEDGLIIPSGSPFIIQLLEVPRWNDPTTVLVRAYGVDTFVDATSASGQKVLNVDNTTGFSPGDNIIINRGGAREEEKVIDTVQAGVSLTVTVNLTYEHTSGQADITEKFIAFAETGGAPAQSQFRVDYPPDDGEGTGLIEFNTNDATKEVMVTYKATGSPMLAETLDTKVSYPTGAPGDGQIVSFSSGAPLWRDFTHVLISGEHTASGLTIGHVIRASAAAAYSFAQLQHGDLGGVTSDLHHPQAHSLASHSSKTHAELTSVTSDQHHPQAHSLASHSSKPHSALSDAPADAHHPQSHTLVSHSARAHTDLTGVSINQHHPQTHGLGTHSDFSTYINQALLTTSDIIHNSGLFNGKLSLGNATELTIANDTITVTRSFHIIDTQGNDPLDNLQTINGGVDGMILILRPANSSRTIHVREAGNIEVVGIYQALSSLYSTITLLYDLGKAKWMQIAYSDND